ncbi:hypothetical protein ACTA71_000866 [Dictyostelium dimigraforme]
MRGLAIFEIVMISFLFLNLNVESKEINCLHLQQEECNKHKDICFSSNVNSCCEKDFFMCLPISSKYCESSTEELFSNKILKKSPPSNSHEWCLKKKKSILRFNTSCVPEVDSESEYFKPNLYKCKFTKCQKGFKCVDETLHKKCETENNSCCKYESKCIPTKDINPMDGPIFKTPKGQLAVNIYNHLNPDSQSLKDKSNHDNDNKNKNKNKNKKHNNKNNNNNNKNKNNKGVKNEESDPLDRIINDKTPLPWKLKNSKQQQQQQKQQKKQNNFKPGSPYPVLPLEDKESTTHLNTIEPTTTFTSSSIRYQLQNDNIKNDEVAGENDNDESVDKKKKNKNKNKKKNKKTKKPKNTKKPTTKPTTTTKPKTTTKPTEKPSKKPKVTEQPADDPSIEITEEPTVPPTLPPTHSPIYEDPCKRASCPIGSHCLVYANQAYCKLDKPPTFPTINPSPPPVKKLDSLSLFLKKSRMLLSEYTTEDKPQLTCSTIKCEDDEVCVNKPGLNPYCKLKPPPSPLSYNKSSCSECPVGSFRCNPNPNGSGVICDIDVIDCRLIGCKDGEFCIDNIENTPPSCYPKLICPRSKIPPGYYCVSDPIRGGYYVKYESQIDLSCETLLCQGSNSYCVEKGPTCKSWSNETVQYQPSCDKCPKDTMSCMPDDNNKNRVVCRVDHPTCSVVQCPENQYCVNSEKGPKCYKRSIDCSSSRCPLGYTCIRDENRGGSCLKN